MAASTAAATPAETPAVDNTKDNTNSDSEAGTDNNTTGDTENKTGTTIPVSDSSTVTENSEEKSNNTNVTPTLKPKSMSYAAPPEEPANEQENTSTETAENVSGGDSASANENTENTNEDNDVTVEENEDVETTEEAEQPTETPSETDTPQIEDKTEENTKTEETDKTSGKAETPKEETETSTKQATSTDTSTGIGTNNNNSQGSGSSDSGGSTGQNWISKGAAPAPEKAIAILINAKFAGDTVSTNPYKTIVSGTENNDAVQLIADSGTVIGNGTLSFAISDNGSIAPTDGWYSDITSDNLKRGIGTYYIWYRISETEKYKAVDPTCYGSITIQNPYKAKVNAVQKLFTVGEAALTDQDIVTINGIECYVLQVVDTEAQLITKNYYDSNFADLEFTADYSESDLYDFMNSFYSGYLNENVFVENKAVGYYYKTYHNTHDRSLADVINNGTKGIVMQYVSALDAQYALQYADKFAVSVSPKSVKHNLFTVVPSGFYTTAGDTTSLLAHHAYAISINGTVDYVHEDLLSSILNKEYYFARPTFWISIAD